MSGAKIFSWDEPSRKTGASSSTAGLAAGLDEAEAALRGWAETDSSDDEDQGPVDPTQQFLEYLLWNNQRGHMTAKQICTVAFWASQAGATGMDVLAVNPESSGGNFQKKVDQFVGNTQGSPKGSTYVVQVPAMIHSTGSREVWDLHTMPPHEVLGSASEGEITSMTQQLRKTLANEEMPSVYTDHPIVKSALPEELVMPLALFMDGVRYGKKGSILGVTIQSILPGSRKYLSVVVRKAIACSCGCGRWCTLFPIFLMLKWSLECLGKGEWPHFNHLGESWDAVGDAVRGARAGGKLPFKGALVQIRCDWMELAHTLGFPSWKSGKHPCMLCKVSHEQMHKALSRKPSLVPFRWPLKGWEDYCSACQDCEQVLENPSLTVCKALPTKMETRQKGKAGAGFTLTATIAKTCLKPGDRFEPTEGGLSDWQQIDGRKHEGKICFWRPAAETMAKHRNPLFQQSLGTDLWNVIAVDAMHTWSLGIFQQFLAGLLWAILDTNLFLRGGGAREDKNRRAMAEMNKLLLDFYRRVDTAEPGHRPSRMELRIEALGKKRNQLVFACEGSRNDGSSQIFWGAATHASSSLACWCSLE